MHLLKDAGFSSLEVSGGYTLYGNGFTLNFHNLTYPYDVIKVTNDDGTTIEVPQLNLKNLFRGEKNENY